MFAAEPKRSVSSQRQGFCFVLRHCLLLFVLFLSKQQRGCSGQSPWTLKKNNNTLFHPLSQSSCSPEAPKPQAPTWRLRRVERIPPCEGCEVRTSRCGPLQTRTLFTINVQPCASREGAPRCEGPCRGEEATVSCSTGCPITQQATKHPLH